MGTAAVIGSGPNGLAAAIRVAQAGFDVTVIEAHEQVGGGTRTSERTVPGVLHDDCAAFHPMGVASPFFASLALERHGLRWRWPEVELAHPLDDGRAGVIARTGERTGASLGVDARRWARLFANPTHRFSDLLDDVLAPVVHVPRHPLTLGRFGWHAAQPATWTAARFVDEPAKALFIGAAAHAFGRLDTPMSSAPGLVLAAAAQVVGWPVVEGGTQRLTEALLAELATWGGQVVTGVRVTSLDDIREVVGLRPDLTFLDTAASGAVGILADALPGRMRRALSRFRYGPAAFKVDLAIEGDLPWRNEDCRRAGTLHLGGSAAQIAAAEKATTRGVAARRPFVLVGQQYLADPSRSNGTINPIYAYAHVPHGFDGDATDAIIDQIDRFAPGVREQIVAVARRTPGDFESANPNWVGGDISAGANTARQIVARPRFAANPYSLGVAGVYLCSSATPPGGGVHGMAGFNAAQAALGEHGM